MTGQYLAGLKGDLYARVVAAARVTQTALNYASFVDHAMKGAAARSPPGRLN